MKFFRWRQRKDEELDAEIQRHLERPPAQVPIPIEINPVLDTRMPGFTLLVSVLAGVLFGLAPAWQAPQPAQASFLKEGRGALGGRRARFSLRNILVVSQVAVSLLLLICAGLFLRSLGQAHNVDPGLETERVLTVQFDLEPGGYDATRGAMFYGLDHRFGHQTEKRKTEK